MAQITETRKIGAVSIAYIDGVTLEQVAGWGFNSRRSDCCVELRYSTKSDYAKIVDLVDAANLPTNTAAVASSNRHIERHDVAVARGLNHGKSWIASGYDVDKNSLDPSWEGIAICYVYA